MTGRDIECVVWCAGCRVEKFRVYRVPTGRNGVFENRISWPASGRVDTKTCADCGEPLSRKEDHG